VNELIRVQPARHLRREFARWAVAQRPKVGTVSESAFGVPPRLFTDMPEDLLRGSMVDGRAYVPVDDEPSPPAPAGAPELLGVATMDGLREAAPGQPLPEVPASAYGPDSVPLLPGGGEPHVMGDPEGDAAAMVAATSPELVERAMAGVLLATDLAASNAETAPDFAPLEDAPTHEEEGETRFVLVSEHRPETVVPLGDTGGDTLAGGETTAADTEAVTREDNAGDEGDTEGDEGDEAGDGEATAKPFPCPECTRSFTTSRGREVHLRRVHP
jgi:hypothetical protein